MLRVATERCGERQGHRWVLGFDGQSEVVKPEKLRKKMHWEHAANMRRMNVPKSQGTLPRKGESDD